MASTLTKSQLLDALVELIISGGRRTTAANVRELAQELIFAYPNIADGDVQIIINSIIQVGIRKYANYATFLAATQVTGAPDFEAFVSEDETDEGALTKYSFVNGIINYITLQPNN